MELGDYECAQRQGLFEDMEAALREGSASGPESPLRRKAWVELYSDNGLVTDWYMHLRW